MPIAKLYTQDELDAVRSVSDATTSALRRISHVLSMHGCPAGEDMAVWLARALSDGRAHKLGIGVWDDYIKDVDAVLGAHGYTHEKLRITWIRERLEELATLRAASGQPGDYRVGEPYPEIPGPDETSSAEPCSTN